MDTLYSKAYTEVVEILKYLPYEEYSKIPKERIKFYEGHMDKDYIYKINPEINLSEQKISKETNAILITLFRDYFATDSQKDRLNELLDRNQKEADKEKREKFDPNEIFKKNIKKESIFVEEVHLKSGADKDSNSKEMIEINSNSFLEKIIVKIKKFIHKLHTN